MAEWRGLDNGRFSFRAPGESLLRVNRTVSPEMKRQRELRQRIEAVEERKREERLREGDW